MRLQDTPLMGGKEKDDKRNRFGLVGVETDEGKLEHSTTGLQYLRYL